MKIEKKQMKEYSAKAYSDIIGTPEHNQRKEQMRYFSASKKQRERVNGKENGKEKCAKRSSKTSEKVDIIENFKTEVQKGPYYVCVVCNRCLYRRSVVHFTEEKYPVVEEDFYYANVKSFDDCEYKCPPTCDKHLKKK